jgi:hypothetical protein
MKTTFEVVVRSLVGPEAKNVVRLFINYEDECSSMETLLSAREARELARMLVASADQADELAVVMVAQ